MRPSVVDLEVVPTNFLLRARVNPGTQGPRDELGAETDAQNREFPFECLVDDLDLGSEVRIAVRLVNVHGAAQHYQAVVAVERRLGFGFAVEVHVPVTKTVASEQRVEGAQDLMGDVLKDEKLRHGGSG